VLPESRPTSVPEKLIDAEGQEVSAQYLSRQIGPVRRKPHYVYHVRFAVQHERSVPVGVVAVSDDLPDNKDEVVAELVIPVVADTSGP
jgi:hypothetical protein